MRLFRFLLAAILLTLPSASGFAYTDEVQANLEDAWNATLKVVEPAGIKKMNEKQKTLESRWMEDEIIRRNPLFKNVTSNIYRRRYRMKIRLTQAGDNVQIEVKGDFQEKPKQSALSAPWRSLKKSTQDFDLERAFFMRVLAQLAKDRTTAQFEDRLAKNKGA